MLFPRFNSSQKERQLSVCTYGMVFLLNPESRPNYHCTGPQGTHLVKSKRWETL